MERKLFKDITDDKERAFYASKDSDFYRINIAGPADGESAFKESKNILVKDSTFLLRYPFWHNNNLTIEGCEMGEGCRAALWYCDKVKIIETDSLGIKAFRECQNIDMLRSNFHSEEIFWRCNNIIVKDSSIEGYYAFFECNNVQINNVQFKGKYSFQYVNNLKINNTNLDTKDAFWHAHNVVVENSIIKGEYLGWYSDGLTLINCKISGTQPLCYAKNLTLINCDFEGCDLAFEYAEVNGNIISNITSIKNPSKGKLTIKHVDEYIVDENDHSEGNFELIIEK